MVSCDSRPFQPPTPAPVKWQRVEAVKGHAPPEDYPAGEGFRAGYWRRVGPLGMRVRWERPLYAVDGVQTRAGD